MELTSEIDKMKYEIKHLYWRIDDLAQYSRKNCLEISGFAENTKGEKEDTDKLVLHICNKVIKSTGATLDVGSIENSHRLGPKPWPSRYYC